MFRSFVDYLRLCAAYLRTNMNAQLEYRGAFYSQIAAMFINDGAWVVFWLLFFTRFQVLHGWSLKDVMSLWAVTTAGFGIAYGFMGNAHRRLALYIAQGELDLWLLHPRAVLPHLLLGSTIPSAWGDAMFGYVIYFGFVRPNVQQALMFAVLSIVVAVVFIGFGVMTGSLSFYLGNASTLSDQWRDISITFATYPPTLFDGKVKLLLFTLIPAGFISYLPVESLRSVSIVDLLIAIAGALTVLAAGVGMFYFGLRRYESGNLISMNG
jgi:ABC-2 type transport system permease protein